MNFTSSVFWVFLLLTILIYHAVRGKVLRQGVLLLASLMFARSFAGSWAQLAPIGGFVIVGFLIVRASHAAKSRAVTALGVALYIALFLYLKKVTGFGIETLGIDYAVIGLSYILFRTIHLMIDCSTGEIATPPSFHLFVLYTVNLFCFISGPIQLWDSFSETRWEDSSYLTPEYVRASFSRIIVGVVKMAVVAASADYIFENTCVDLGSVSSSGSQMTMAVRYVVAASAYTGYLYYNFSGYMDVIIAAGALVGLSLPENFDGPFVARSFLEFWQRWHMTLSSWFKTYVFTPLLVAMMSMPMLASAPVAVGVASFFITFLLMGVWHGTTSVFVVYGFLMGLGASVNKLWASALTSSLSRSGAATLRKNALYAHACRGITFAYFTMALTCLWIGTTSRLIDLLAILGSAGLALAFAIMAGAFALLFPVYDFVNGWMRRLGARAFASPLSINLAIAARVVGVAMIVGLLSKAPDFVLRGLLTC